MFRLIGAQEVIKNLIRLTKKPLTKPFDKKSLQQAYRDFLLEIQPTLPKPEALSIELLATSKEIEPFLRAFKEDSSLDDFDEVFAISEEAFSEQSIQRMENALDLMQNKNPSYYEVIELVIHTIFSAPSKYAGGGSTSAAIGCIWIDSRPHWNNQDFMEFLIHETTHNLVFLDELCFTHYTNYSEIAKKENFSWSAILNKPRPLDKVFHSIIVGTEVISFRNDYVGHPLNPHLHPPTDILLEQTLHSILYLEENSHLKRLLTSRAQALLSGCLEILEPVKR